MQTSDSVRELLDSFVEFLGIDHSALRETATEPVATELSQDQIRALFQDLLGGLVGMEIGID